MAISSFRVLNTPHGKISIKSYFMRSLLLFFSLYLVAVKCWIKLLPFGVNCRLQLAGIVEKREETVKPTRRGSRILKWGGEFL